MTVQKLIELLKEKDPKLQVFLDAEETDVTKMVNAIEAQIGRVLEMFLSITQFPKILRCILRRNRRRFWC